MILTGEFFNTFLFSLFSFVGLISVVVFIHEFGHYSFARMCGVKVESFSIGFGKEIFGFNSSGGTRWKFCIIPVGGYVKMLGEGIESSEDSSEAFPPDAFCSKALYQKALIVFAGPAFNLLSAFFMLSFLFFGYGEYVPKAEVGGVYSNSPADIADLKDKDVIKEVGGLPVVSIGDLVVATEKFAGRSHVKMKVERQGESKTLFIDFPPAGGRLGIVPSGVKVLVKSDFFRSVKRGFLTLVYVVQAVVDSLKKIVTSGGIKEIGGPVRIATYSLESVKKGFYESIWFIAMISVNLGVVNLLPIPMLDGGHLFQYLLEATVFRGRTLGANYRKVAFVIGFSVVFLLMAFALFNDFRYILIGD